MFTIFKIIISLFFIKKEKKETLAQMFSYEFCEFSKNTFLYRHLIQWLLPNEFQNKKDYFFLLLEANQWTCFLYDRDFRHERVKQEPLFKPCHTSVIKSNHCGCSVKKRCS